MKPTALIRFACAVSCMLCTASLSAQFPGRQSLADNMQADGALRPNQRILPLPSGGTGVLQQIELLERLNSLAGDQQQPSPELTESQLKMLDHVVKNFRNDSGELELPNLDMLPPGLLGNLLSDPVQRQQARRLLEQYARQRNLGLPGSSPTLPKLPVGPGASASSGQMSEPSFDDRNRNDRTGNDRSGNDRTGNDRSGNDRNSNPFERTEPSSRKPASNSNSNSNANSNSDANANPKPKLFDTADIARPLETIREKNREEPRGRGSDSPKPNELRDIENLLKNLRWIDEAQKKSANNKSSAKARTGDAGRSNASGANSSRQSSGARNRGPRSTDGQAQNAPRSNRLQPPGSASGQRYPGMSPIPNTFPPMPEVDGQFDSSSAERDSGSGTNGQPGETAATPGSALEERSFRLDVNELDLLDPFRENGKSPSSPGSAANPFADPSTNRNRNGTPPRSFRVKELAESLPATPAGQGNGAPRGKGNTNQALTNPSLSNDNSTGSDARGRSSTEQPNNLFQSLRNLVNKTLQEQGHDERSAKDLLRQTTRGLIPGSQRSDPGSLTNSGVEGSPFELPSSAANGTARNRTLADGENNAALGTNATSTAAAPSVPAAWRSLMRDVWRSITVPPTSAATDTASSFPSTRAIGSGQMPSLTEFFNTRVLSVLAAAALALAAIYWLARRGQSQSDPSSDSHDRWVREVLTYGLKSRADVVRAFHLFVMQTSQPVAAWWNHRHVARQLAATSPQMGAALDELAGVYEQARYTPPDVPLQAEQLERMRLALEQCKRS